jgi:DNA-binding transcriptional regulator YdaS (Cro superfamily)
VGREKAKITKVFSGECFRAAVGASPADALREIVDQFNGPAKLAEALEKATQHKVSRTSVNYWLSSHVPAPYVLTLEWLSGYKVKRWQLRPDLYPPTEHKAIYDALKGAGVLA